MYPPYTDFFGSGEAFYAQLTTLLAITLGIIICIAIFIRLNLWKQFASFALFALVLWIIFGTLDVTVTTRCAYIHPEIEQNLDARWFFEHFGFFGGALASITWILVWAIVIALLLTYGKKHKHISHLIILTILYSLANGHFLGFSTWMEQLQSIAEIRNLVYPYQPLPSIALGAALALLQTTLFKPRMRNIKRQR